MEHSTRTAVIVLAAIGLVALSGIALAADDDGNDTVFNYGYDEDSQFFMWNVTSLEYDPNHDALDETLGDEETAADTDFEALLEACGLAAPEGGEEALEYGYTFDGETIELYALTDGSFDPETEEPVQSGECGEVTGGSVTGPEGQVNHGMFLRLFNSLYDGSNRGCLVRHIAQSDLGKGEQQIEAEPDFEGDDTVEPIEDGSVDFTTIATDCLHGVNGVGDEDEVEGAEEDTDRRGPPQWVRDKLGDDHPANGGNGGGDDEGGDDKGNGNGAGRPEGVGGGRP